MATKKVTVTLQHAQLAMIQALIATGKADSVSGFVQHAVSLALDDIAGWSQTLEHALEATGGRLSRKERAWADSILKPSTKRARAKARKGRAA